MRNAEGAAARTVPHATAPPRPGPLRPSAQALGLVDGLAAGPDEPRTVAVQDAGVGRLDGAVQTCLPAERRQDRVDRVAQFLFAGEDIVNRLWRDRLNVGPFGELRVGHDRGGIAVDQDDPVPLLAENLASLGP